MSFVLDNSVTMCWLLANGKPADMAYADSVLGALRARRALVPSLWAPEAANVIAKGEAKGLFTEARSQAFVALLGRLNIVTDPATASHAFGDTLHLARRYRLSSYDASYLELALRSGAPLASLDADLVQAAKAVGVQPFKPD